MSLRRLTRVAVILLGLLPSNPVGAAQLLALFPFELVDTSPVPPTSGERARLEGLNGQVRQRFIDAGFELVDLAPVASALARVSALRDCNGCDLDMARQAGAELSGIGWVQKVSNLILNINLQIRDVATGRPLAAGSVDIRGNTDESWRRGLKYLLDHRILGPARTPP